MVVNKLSVFLGEFGIVGVVGFGAVGFIKGHILIFLSTFDVGCFSSISRSFIMKTLAIKGQ